jgi:hypothetical protein
MKKDILKIAGVKSEKEFYKKYPTEAAFMKAHGKEFKKAAMGASMVNKQLTQLTDFSNPPQAQNGKALWHSEWNQDPYAQYTGTDDAEAAYLAEIDARNVAQNPMKTPSVNVPKSAIEAKKPGGSGYSVVDYLNSTGKKSDFNTRKALAESQGIKGYTGTAEQNLRLLSNLKGKTSAAQKAVSSTASAPKKTTPAQEKTAKAAEASKLSRAEEYIAKDPYFFAEESDPDWIKAIDAPFSGLRNLGARVVLDQDPMAALKLLAMGAFSNTLVGQTKTMPYNPMQISGAASAASKAIPYATRALPGFAMGGYMPNAQVGAFIGGEQSSYKPMNYTELYDNADYANTGSNRQMRMQEQNLAAQQTQAANAGKKGGLDLGSLMESAGGVAKLAESLRQGGYIHKAQLGDMISQFGPKLASYSKGMINSPTGQVTQAQTEALGFKSDGSNFNSNKFALGMQNFGKDIGAGYDKLDSSLGKVGGVGGAMSIGTDLLQGFQQLKEEKNQQKEANQAFQLSGLTKQVAGLTPDIQQRKYNRPEDQAFGTQEMGQAYGAGTNFLAEDGAMVGGNLTEIQNMYNPGDIYSDMGYEPLSDSEIVKQYRRGGLIPRAQFGMDKMAGQAGGALGSLIGGGKGKPNAGGQIGSTIGSTVGKFIPIPGASAILGAVGGITGGILGGKSAKKTEAWQTGAEQNTQDTAFMSGAKNLQAQNQSFMEDGGEVGLKYLSHDWQPQVITQFGGYNMKDLLKADPTMDTLRAGGHLGQVPYTPASARAMSTERSDFAMGGQLKTTWGGDAEPISYNPYLPGSGETVMFRGKSHDESDGNGHTGIGVKYGQGAQDSYTDYAEYGTEQADADVEVERGEPATELPDSETGDVSMVVYGNMQIPSYGAAELGDSKIKGKKFKSYANDLSKMEAKQNKTVEKGLKLIDSVDSDNPFDLLKLQSGQAMVEGANMKLKGLAIQKQRLAGIQNAILDTAKERGLESDALAKGKIKQDKNSDMAKFGAKLETAQGGINQPLSPIWPMSTYYRIDPTTDFKMETSPEVKKQIEEQSKKAPAKKAATKKATVKAPERAKANPITSIDIPKKDLTKQLETSAKNITAKVPDYAKNLKPIIEEEVAAKEDKFGLDDLLRQVQPYLIPSNQEDFDYSSISPELNALAQNQLEPVQAQTFQPLLEQPYSVSLQDQLNANQADFNALQRQVGYNPAALSQLAAQKYSANSAVLGQQARINQEMQMGAFNRNRGVLNDAALKNLATLDQQYVRQSQAKSNTKAQAQAALTSIADKIAKNKLENRTLGVYENMYNYRFGPKGRAINVNAPYEFNTDLASMTADQLQAAANKRRESEKTLNKQNSARNGNIVKAIKNL